MHFASTVVFALLTLLPRQANLTGTWVLDRVRSDFGQADAPRRLILHLDEAGDRIAASIFIVGDKDQHVAYRECRVGIQLDGVLSCVTADGVSPDEVWQVTA